MIFFRISRQILENSDVCRFFNQICENKSEICRKFWILWKKFTIISELFTSLLNRRRVAVYRFDRDRAVKKMGGHWPWDKIVDRRPPIKDT